MAKHGQLALGPGPIDEIRVAFLFRLHVQHSFTQKIEEEVDYGSMRLHSQHSGIPGREIMSSDQPCPIRQL